MIRMTEDLGASAAFDCSMCGVEFLFQDMRSQHPDCYNDPAFCPICGAPWNAKSVGDLWESGDGGTVH